MNILPILGSRLSGAGLGAPGVKLFYGLLPDKPDAAVGLSEYVAPGPVHAYGSVVDRVRVQVLWRCATLRDYPALRDEAEAGKAVLDFADLVLSGVRILRCEPVTSVHSLGADDAERWVLSCNFEVLYER